MHWGHSCCIFYKQKTDQTSDSSKTWYLASRSKLWVSIVCETCLCHKGTPLYNACHIYCWANTLHRLRIPFISYTCIPGTHNTGIYIGIDILSLIVTALGYVKEQIPLYNTSIMIGHVTLAAITGTILLVPYLLDKSLQLIWRSVTCRLHQYLPDCQIIFRPDYMTGHQDSSPSNGHQGTCPLLYILSNL